MRFSLSLIYPGNGEDDLILTEGPLVPTSFGPSLHFAETPVVYI